MAPSSTKRDDWGVRQSDWAALIDMSASDFIEYVRDDILPELSLWLEWHTVIKELNLKNQSPSKEEVVRRITNMHGLISQLSETLVESEQLDAKTVTANAVFLISLELRDIDICSEKYPNPEDMYGLAWKLLRFIQKNLGSGRCLSGDKAEKAQANGSTFVASE